MNVNELLRKQAEIYNDKSALIDEDNNIKYSYKDLIKAIDNLSIILRRSGFKQKEKIAIYMNNSINWIISFYALLNINAVPVLIDYQYTKRELEECLGNSETYNIIVDDNQNKINAIDNIDRINKAIVLSKNKENSFKDIFRTVNYDLLSYDFESIKNETVYYDDNEIILFTYRGLGYALPVVLTEESIVNSVYNNIDVTLIDPSLIIGLFLPLHHIFALTSNLLCPLSVAGTLIITNNYMPINILRIIEKYKINFLLGVPTIVKLLLYSLKKRSYDLTSVKKGVIGGDRFEKSLSDQWQEVTGNFLMQGYGLTETCPVICNRLNNSKAGSLGLAMKDVKVKILDENDNELQINKPGRLLIKSNTLMTGYYNNNKLNKELIKEQFFDTGDIAYRDMDDFYYFVKRDKKIAKIGGSTVDMNEILNVVLSNPDVSAAEISIAEDNLWQEKLVLHVALKKCLSRLEIYDYLKNKLCPSKLPRDIIIE
jgi:acyl-CoA synthetase (AMP-forming)/AMP-acid ligase II